MNRQKISAIMPALAAALASQGVLLAEIKPNPLFTDGAVLQSGQSVPVWGTARDGEKVTVEIGEQKVSTTATNGLWRVNLKPLTAGGPFTMTLTGDNVVTVNQILVGEVWVCSGQSNMEWPLQRAANADQEIPLANYPKIRMFTVKKNVSIKPLAEAEGRWVECSPASAGGFSAVGYFFARDLYQKINVPVGMINTSWGGTPAESWTSIEGLAKDPELKSYLDAAQVAIANYPTKVAAYSRLSPRHKWHGRKPSISHMQRHLRHGKKKRRKPNLPTKLHQKNQNSPVKNLPVPKNPMVTKTAKLPSLMEW